MTKDRRWLYIAILSLFLAIVWVGISVYAKLRESSVPPDVQKAVTPLDPQIDKSVFDNLQKRQRGSF